jgi:hypothetical protein
MPENYGKEVKEVENSVSYDRKPEFKGEQPPSQYESYSILLKLLHKLYRDDSFSKKYNKDNENQIISIEYSQGSKKICSVPRKDLLETNSIALAEGGHERVNRYTIGNYIPSKAMKAAKLGTVYCPENILGDKTDEVSNLSKISGKSRLEKERSRLAEERNNLSYNEQSGASDYSDYLDDETEGIVNLEKISGLSRIAKARKDSSDTDGLVNTDYSDYLDDEYDGIVNFDEISKIRRKDKESTEDAIP